MNKEVLDRYRPQLQGRLKEYLRREGLMSREGDFCCPHCGRRAVLEDREHWDCTVCGMHGDLLDYAALRSPRESMEEILRRVCRTVGVKYTELETFTSRELSRMELPRREDLVEGLLAARGVTILAAPSKTGKSWMALQLSAALIRGEPFLERRTRPCRVLYLALEDDKSRLKERCASMDCLDSEDLSFCTRTELLGKGFEEAVVGFLERQETGLVIVDTLQKVREVGRETPSYGMDYQTMDRFKDLSQRFQTAVLLIHHTNKREGAEDAMSSVSGTMAITGGADGIWLLQRPRRLRGDALLQVTGRDTSDQLLRLAWEGESCRWRCLGTEEGETIPATKREQEALLDALDAYLEPGDEWVGSATELLEALELSLLPNRLSRLLNQVQETLERQGICLEWQRRADKKILHFYRQPSGDFFRMTM